MRFCESYAQVANQTVGLKGGRFECLKETLQHPLIEAKSRWHELSCEHILYNSSQNKWKQITGLSEVTRNRLILLVTREEFPATLFIPEQEGWVIFYNYESLRKWLFDLSRVYYDKEYEKFLSRKQFYSDVKKTYKFK